MKLRYLLPLVFSFALGASAAQPKEYQVTGPIVALTDDVITVDKSGEKWEIGRSAATKVTGKLAVGSKVTVGASASDNRKVARVEFWVDGVLKLKDTTAPFSYVWTVPTPKGVKRTLLARAVDTSNSTADASVVVTAN